MEKENWRDLNYLLYILIEVMYSKLYKDILSRMKKDGEDGNLGESIKKLINT